MAQKHYTEREKLILINLVKEFAQVVENKRTDAVGNLEKEEVCRAILEKYNKEVTFQRTTASLRNCWQHIKTDARKYSARFKAQSTLTGGGKNTVRLSVIDEAALEIIHPISVGGLQNIFDSDAENECPNKVVFDHLLKTKEIKKWKKWDPKKLKSTLSTPLHNALINASQPIPSTSTGITDASRRRQSTDALREMKLEALERELLKTKLEREKLELAILKANNTGGNHSNNPKTKKDDDDSILLSSDSN